MSETGGTGVRGTELRGTELRGTELRGTELRGTAPGETLRPGTGLRVVTCADVRPLADDLVARFARPVEDPFAQPLVVVPGPGVQRWLSQQVALGSDSARGICAGVSFSPLSSLETMLSGDDPRDDAWSPERLVWPILSLAESGLAGLEPLARNLQASEQRYANALRVARLLARYTRHRPDLGPAWSGAHDAADLGLGFDAWQATLWRALHTIVDGPDPAQRRQDLVRGLAEGRVAVPWPWVGVFAPRRLTAGDADLLRALGSRVEVVVWLALPGPVGAPGGLQQRLGRRALDTARTLAAVADELDARPAPPRPPTLLGELQRALDAGLDPRPDADHARHGDGSVDVRASHGPARQAEVVREVLVGLFEDDPTLEPRDVVIACPAPEVLAPHLGGVFSPEEGGSGWQHPGRSLRVQVAAPSAAQANLAYGLARDVLELGGGRATRGDLLALCGHPFVARRFGFTTDGTDRLADLLEQASVRWGVDTRHRARFGLDRVPQGTWQAGVQRLMMGEALSDDALASARHVATVDEVESSDVALLGGLAELVSRVSRLIRACGVPAPGPVWVDRIRSIVADLTDVGSADAWQVAQLWAALDRMGRRCAGATPALGPADALALLDDEFAGQTARPAFGNGSLVVCSLEALAQVPHRVVCLVGLDDRSFPRRPVADGDDLLARDPRPGDPDPGLDDRQALLDAVGAATERLVVVYQGRSALTNEEYKPPLGLVDLLDALGLTPKTEPLQPFAPASFAGTPVSFDRAALQAARALVAPRAEAPDRYAVTHLPLPEPPSVDLETLRAFLQHPVRYFLRNRAQLSLVDENPATDQLPLELDGLGRWRVGERMLHGLLRGHPLDAVVHQEWLRGQIPPGELGRRELDRIAGQAQEALEAFGSYREAPVDARPVDLSLAGVRLTGRVTTRAGRPAMCAFARVGARHLAEAWLDALALAAQADEPVQAVVVGPKSRRTLTVADPARARDHLADLVGLATEGLQRILLMPPRTCEVWAQARLRGQDPLADRRLEHRWAFDNDALWRRYVPRGTKPWDVRLTGDEPWARPGETTQLGALASIVWTPIVGAER